MILVCTFSLLNYHISYTSQALTHAGEKAKGCTAYVSLEPCNHFGRTPPCTQALIKNGIKRVVAGMVDPDSRVSGQGLETLRKNGVQVEVDVEGEACTELNKAFVHRIKTSHPYSIVGIKIKQNEKIDDVTLVHEIPSRVEIEEMLRKAIPDVDTIVISIDDIQEWVTGEITLPSHVDLVVTALDKAYTPWEIEQMKDKLSMLSRKILLLTKVKDVHENVFEYAVNENCCREASIIQDKTAIRTGFDMMGEKGVFVKEVEESEVSIKSVFDVLGGMQSNAVLHVVNDMEYLAILKDLNHVQELLIFTGVTPDINYVESIIGMVGTTTSQSKSRDIFESYKCTTTIADEDSEVNTILIKL